MGISVDSVETNTALAARLGLSSVPLAADPDLSAVRAYGLEHVGKDISLPATIVIRTDGTIAWIYVGDNPRDRPSLEAMLAPLDPA